jgi:iron complex outermembrane receptor protein
MCKSTKASECAGKLVIPRPSSAGRVLCISPSILVVMSAFVVATSASGQSAPATTSDANELEAITVTARRREENIERVPLTVEIITAKQLADREIRTESDLQYSVPGLTVRQTESQNQLTYSIRGQTVDAFTGSASAVVPYVDEIQLNSGGASTFFDLDSIQVLKGPQGTLFGRNATGGAILFTTVKPKNDFEGYLEARGGNYRKGEVDGALNAPIVDDKLLVRVAFDVDYMDGYVHNFYDNSYLGAVNRQSGRISLTWHPVDAFINTTVFEYDRSGGNDIGTELSHVNQCSAPFVPIPPTINCAASSLADPANVDAVFGPGSWAAYLAQHPKAFPGGITAFAAYQQKIGPWNADQVGISLHKEHSYFLADTATYELSSNMQIKNIFGISYDSLLDSTSQSGSPYALQFTSNTATGQVGNFERTHNASEELQLQGKALGNNLTYVLGAYYQDMSSNIFYPQTYFDFPPYNPATNVDDQSVLKDRTEALYGQGTYDLRSMTGIEGLSFTGGYRYTFEQTGRVVLPGDPSYGVPPQKLDFSNPSWTAGIAYQITPDLMVYVDGRRSWRSGGLNVTAPAKNTTAAGGGDQFFPETTRAVELGAKFGGRIFGHVARINVALYDQSVRNIQRAEFPLPPGSTAAIAVTVNVPGAEIKGVEIDSEIEATDWLKVGGTGAITDASFSGTANVFGTTYTFGPFGDTPKYTGTVFAQVALPGSDSIGKMTLRPELYGQSQQYFSNNANTIIPFTRLPGYALLNLRYDWSGVFGSQLSVAAYCKNALERGYYVGGFAQGAVLGVNSVSVGTPRFWGVEAKYRF